MESPPVVAVSISSFCHCLKADPLHHNASPSTGDITLLAVMKSHYEPIIPLVTIEININVIYPHFVAFALDLDNTRGRDTCAEGDD